MLRTVQVALTFASRFGSGLLLVLSIPRSLEGFRQPRTAYLMLRSILVRFRCIGHPYSDTKRGAGHRSKEVTVGVGADDLGGKRPIG